MASHEPLPDVEKGEGGKMSMKSLQPDGSVKVQAVQALQKGVKVCCLPEPPGGWYGPFGMFRLISYVFCALAIFGIVMFVYGIYEKDWFGIIASLLLVLASAFSAIASYAHEGLAREVSEVARQNDRFANSNLLLAHRVDELGDTQTKITSIADSMQGGLEALEDTIHGLHQVRQTSQLSAILSAFLTADSFGEKVDGRIQDDGEVDEFIDVCENILKESAPDFDIEKFGDVVREVGLDLDDVRLLISAVIAGSDADPGSAGKCEAVMSLLLFALKPAEHLEETSDKVALVLSQHSSVTRAKIKGMLKELMDEYADDENTKDNTVPGERLLTFSAAVLLCGQDGEGKKAVNRLQGKNQVDEVVGKALD